MKKARKLSILISIFIVAGMLFMLGGCGSGGGGGDTEVSCKDCSNDPGSSDNNNASGTYSYNSQTGVMDINIEKTNYTDCGPDETGTETVNVTSLTSTNLVWNDTDDDGDALWTRDGGSSGDIVGTWKASDDDNSMQLTFNSNGTWSLIGEGCGGSSSGGGGEDSDRNSVDPQAAPYVGYWTGTAMKYGQATTIQVSIWENGYVDRRSTSLSCDGGIGGTGGGAKGAWNNNSYSHDESNGSASMTIDFSSSSLAIYNVQHQIDCYTIITEITKQSSSPRELFDISDFGSGDPSIVGTWDLLENDGVAVPSGTSTLVVTSTTFSATRPDCHETGTYTADGSTITGTTLSAVGSDCDVPLGTVDTTPYTVNSTILTTNHSIGGYSIWKRI